MKSEDVFQSKKEVAKGSFWSLTGNLTFNLISFFYVILVARAVSPDDLGLFYLAFGIVTIIGILDNFGIAGSISRYVPFFEGKKEFGKIRVLLRSSYVLMTISAFIFAILLWFAADFIGEIYQNVDLPEALRMFSVFLILSNLFKTNMSYLRGRADLKSQQFNVNLQNLLKLILTVAFFHFFGASLYTLITAFLTSYLISTLISFISVSTRTKDLPTDNSTIEINQLFLEILPFGIMFALLSSLNTVLSSANRLLLAYLVDPAEAASIVAVYTVASTLAWLGIIFSGSIGSIFLPVISRLYGKKDFEHIRSVTATAQRWSLFLTVPAVAVMFFFSSEMLLAFYGPAYMGGALVMSVISITVMIKSISAVLSLVLSAMRVVKLQLKMLIFTGLFNILLDIILIPYYGMLGVALASLIGGCVMILIIYHYSKKLFNFRFSQEFYKMLAAAVMTFLMVAILRPFALMGADMLPQWYGGIFLYISKIIYLSYLGILLGFSFVFFMLLVLLLKCFKEEDVLIMKKAMQKAKIPGIIISLMEGMASHGIAPQEYKH